MPVEPNRRQEQPGDGAGVSFRAPDLMRASLLLLLHEHGDYGYDLRTRLVELSGICCDHGTVYRVLNRMEDEALVSSGWERSSSGPARRRYRLTHAGEDRLDAWSRELARLSRVLGAFEARYRTPHLPGVEPVPAAANGGNGSNGVAAPAADREVELIAEA